MWFLHLLTPFEGLWSNKCWPFYCVRERPDVIFYHTVRRWEITAGWEITLCLLVFLGERLLFPDSEMCVLLNQATSLYWPARGEQVVLQTKSYIKCSVHCFFPGSNSYRAEQFQSALTQFACWPQEGSWRNLIPQVKKLWGFTDLVLHHDSPGLRTTRKGLGKMFEVCKRSVWTLWLRLRDKCLEESP